MKSKYILAFISFIINIFLVSGNLTPCTLWASAGKKTQGMGTIIVKQRDYLPDNYQVLRVKISRRYYSYVGLFSRGGKAPGLKAGVNEHGLVAVSATASSIPRRIRLRNRRTKRFLSKILKRCKTVHEAVRLIKRYKGARFVMLADRNYIAHVEMPLRGRNKFVVKRHGYLYHANHYVFPGMKKWNYRNSKSSKSRHKRIKYLLTKHRHFFTVNDFLKFSVDRHNGPDNSIWRTGSTKRKVRTLSTWIVRVFPNGYFQLFLKIANPGEKMREYYLDKGLFFKKQVK